MRAVSIILVCLLTMTVLMPLYAQKQAPDDLIYDLVRRRLASDPDVKGAMIEVQVKDGAVSLSGKVKTEKARQKAEKLAKKVKGVRSVTNKLVVSPL